MFIRLRVCFSYTSRFNLILVAEIFKFGTFELGSTIDDNFLRNSKSAYDVFHHKVNHFLHSDRDLRVRFGTLCEIMKCNNVTPCSVCSIPFITSPQTANSHVLTICISSVDMALENFTNLWHLSNFLV